MTPLEFVSHVRFMTRTNSATFLDADIIRLMKIRQDELAKAILKADEDILLIPQYTSLVLNQREYALPADMLASIKRVEAKFDGTNFIPLYEVDITKINTSIKTETDITNYFNNNQVTKDNPNGAVFDLGRKALTIYSGTIITVVDGFAIWVNTWPSAITDLTLTTDMSSDPSTTTHGIPRELHEIWARGVIIDWKSSREKPIPLSGQELIYMTDKKEAVDALKPQNRDRQEYLNIPSASDRGNNGEDY